MKINPGQLVMYISIVFAIFAIVFAGMFSRLDALVLAMGVGLTGYGAGLEAPMALLLASMGAFLGAYLPFGLSSKAEIAGFSEGFENEEFEDNNNEGFACKSRRGVEGFKSGGTRSDDDENFENEGFKNCGKRGDNDENFEEEGFKSGGKRGAEDEGFESEDEGFESENEGFEGEGESEGFEGDNENNTNSDENEGFANPDGKKKTRKKIRPPPDNANYKGMLELGKKYKIPSEKDDPDFHLDAGTTFMNAYKSLKPDQISAMTKDTQELINTQKQLMSTLNTLKPLMSDGKQIMDTFQNYFGAGGLGGMEQLGAMADKFAPK